VALKKPVVLTILDGWGYRAEQFANAIALARKPTYDKLLAEFPHSLLHASDHFVGLPDGQMGNSEVGHLNIGSGRVVHMDITRIDDLIRSGEFFRHPVIVAALKHAGEKGRALHLLGLLSDGGVHSDTLPTSGVGYLEKLQRKINEIGVGKIASVGGRYFAMDRDRRWERAKKAFDAMLGKTVGGAYTDPVARVKESYHNGITDEFVEPFVVVDAAGKPVGTVSDGDACICFNYRADRVRQITRVLARNSGLTKADGKDLPGAEDLDQMIPPAEVPRQLHYVCMTQYDKQFTLPMVILPESMENLLADMLAQANLRNLRIAETEKYAHVTYFFNGGVEKPFAGEDRMLVPSQKVATYDLAPEMSASGIADAVITAIGDPAFDLVVVNFANADMVGHSGKIEPTIQGVETIDTCLGRIYQTLKQRGGSMLITADHGNAELMIDPVSGGPHTSHTTNPVPVILVSDDAGKYRLREGGSLRDISPTLLGMLGLEKPARMTGGDLRVKVED
jgi:2,3-bisphosphoglycerate-independent phosphoglycerate mutase